MTIHEQLSFWSLMIIGNIWLARAVAPAVWASALALVMGTICVAAAIAMVTA